MGNVLMQQMFNFISLKADFQGLACDECESRQVLEKVTNCTRYKYLLNLFITAYVDVCLD